MIREIVLHGNLEKYGTSFMLDVKSAQEGVHALASQIKGFYSDIRRGEFRVFADSIAIDEVEIMMDLGTVKQIHIIPVPIGSKEGGLLKVVLGVALLGVGFAVGLGTSLASGGLFAGMTGGTLALMGAGFLLNGIGMMLSPSPSVDSNEKADQRPSYIFNSPMNITEEGNCLPCAYGIPYCSTLAISSGFDTEAVDLSLNNVNGFSASISFYNSVTLSWNAVSGAASYVIRYGDSSATWESYSSSFTATGTSAVRVLSNGTYKFLIRAVNGSLYSRDASSTSITVDYTPSSGDDGNDDGGGGQ